jgi:hypothetical protein
VVNIDETQQPNEERQIQCFIKHKIRSDLLTTSNEYCKKIITKIHTNPESYYPIRPFNENELNEIRIHPEHWGRSDLKTHEYDISDYHHQNQFEPIHGNYDEKVQNENKRMCVLL